MAYDTKYRPLKYSDVLGQGEYKEVLCEIVRSGTGFHQSYLFAGQHGSGKTTLGRILARALLCESPRGGEPCDECSSCHAVLEGRSECFIEFDAATNSGKEDIKRIVDELQVSTFSGRPRIYLFDESHQLSKQALDALLKPMEDEQSNSENKQLVCIFCTTEPERMRTTIFSRCAPAFTIRPVPSEEIAGRLAYVCENEGLEYDQDALLLLAEFHESHIRDALKSMEGISKLGKISEANAHRYLRTGASQTCIQILQALGTDLPRALTLGEELHDQISPSVAYKRLAEIAMISYRGLLGVGTIPRYLKEGQLATIADRHREYLLVVTAHLSDRPAHPTQAMLLCDIAYLHHGKLGSLPMMAVSTSSIPVAVQTAPPPVPPVLSVSDAPPSTLKIGGSTTQTDPGPVKNPSSVGKVQTDPAEPSAGSTPEPNREVEPGDVAESGNTTNAGHNLDFYRAVLRTRVEELGGSRRGSKGRSHMGGA